MEDLREPDIRTSRLLQTEWFRLPPDSPLAGRSIGDVRVREVTGASVVAIVRDETVIPNPGPTVVFQKGDTVGIMGTAEQRAAFERLARGETDIPHNPQA